MLTKQIGTVVIGKNAQWKTEIDLGKQTNQNFVSIPHSRLIEMLEYKARLVGIDVIVQEESYTSRANFLGLDSIPVYGKTEKDPVFTGKRIKRGLYKTSVGQLINSDVNAAYNILSKAIPNAFSNGIESCVVGPMQVNPLKVKVKGEGLNASHVMSKWLYFCQLSANRLNESRIERVFRPESVKPVRGLSLSLSRILIFTPVPDKKKTKKERAT